MTSLTVVNVYTTVMFVRNIIVEAKHIFLLVEFMYVMNALKDISYTVKYVRVMNQKEICIGLSVKTDMYVNIV